MTTDIVQASFDYGMLDAETRIVVQQRTGEIRTLVRKSAQDIIDIGTKLHEVKARLGHGQFGDWLSAEFEWSKDTAGRFMQVAQRFGQIPQIAEFAPSALYLLASPSTPDAAVDEALTRAAAGETISRATAHEIVQEHKPAQQRFAEVWRLQHVVLDAHKHFYKDEETAYACRDMRAAAKARAGGFWNRCAKSMPDDINAWRVSDLAQAINNVAAQMEADANYSTADIASREAAAAEAKRQAAPATSLEIRLVKAAQREADNQAFQAQDEMRQRVAVALAPQPTAEPTPVAEVFDADLFVRAERSLITNCKDGWMRAPFDWHGAYWITVGGVYGGNASPPHPDEMDCVRVHPSGEEIALGVRIGRYRTEAFSPGTELRHGQNTWRIGAQWLVVKRWRVQYVCLACGSIYQSGYCKECHSFEQREVSLPGEAERVSAAVKADLAIRQDIAARQAAAAEVERQTQAAADTDESIDLAALPVVATPNESFTLAAERKARLYAVKRQIAGTLDILPEFGDLTGRHTASLLAGRELTHMLEILDGELDVLQRIEIDHD